MMTNSWIHFEGLMESIHEIANLNGKDNRVLPVVKDTVTLAKSLGNTVQFSCFFFLTQKFPVSILK